MKDIHVEIDKKLDLTIISVKHAVTAKDYIAFIETQYVETPTSNILWDFSASSLSLLATQDFIDIAETVKKIAHLRKRPRTGVIVHKNMEKTVMKMYQVISDTVGSPVAYKIFTTKSDAFQWFESNSQEGDFSN